MSGKARLIFDVAPEEKAWYESILKPGQTKIGLLRELLDEYAKNNKLPARPGAEENQ
jgi:hypothetical protein